MYFSSQARSPTDWKPEFSWIFRMFKAVKSAYIASADVLKPGRMNHSLKATEQDCVPAAGFQRSWLSVIQYINCLPETMFSILWLAYPPAMNHWDHGWKMSPSMIFQANWTSSSWNSQPCWNPWNLRVSSTDFAQDQRVLTNWARYRLWDWNVFFRMGRDHDWYHGMCPNIVRYMTYLVVSLELNFIFHILGMSSSQLTKSYFSEG